MDEVMTAAEVAAKYRDCQEMIRASIRVKPKKAEDTLGQVMAMATAMGAGAALSQGIDIQGTDPKVEYEIDEKNIPYIKESFLKVYDWIEGSLVAAEDSYFGIMLMDMDFAFDLTQQGFADIDVSSVVMVLKINPLYIINYTIKEARTLIISELTKVTMQHPIDYVQLNRDGNQKIHDMLEKASTSSISQMIEHDLSIKAKFDNESRSSGLSIPKDFYSETDMENECGASAQKHADLRYYYDFIRCHDNGGKENGKNGKQSGNNGQSQQSDCMGQSQQSSAGQGQQPGQGQGQGDPKGTAFPGSENGHPTHSWESQGDSESIKNNITSNVKEAWSKYLDQDGDSSNLRGLMPSDMVESIEKLLAKPRTNLWKIIKNMVGTLPTPYRQTRMRVNRRQPYRPDLMGRLPKFKVRIVAAIDTSGSMGDDEIKYCLSELMNLVKQYESEIIVVECDAEIGSVYTIKKPGDIHNKVTGRGGTSYLPVIDWVNGVDDGNQGKWAKDPRSGRLQDALFIYFTDGYGDESIPKPKTSKNIWVIMDDKEHLSVKTPYGLVLSMSTDPNWSNVHGRGY
jgi:predicted metal-dependent peptidase